MKKILASLVAIALFASVAVVFTGCGTSKTFTMTEAYCYIITELNDADAEGNKTIKTEEKLTMKEFVLLGYKMDALGKTFAEAKEYTLTASEQKTFDEGYAQNYQRHMDSMKIELKGEKFIMAFESIDSVNKAGEKTIEDVGYYKKDGKNLTIYVLDSVINGGTEYENYDYEILSATLDGKTLTTIEFQNIGGEIITQDTKDFSPFLYNADGSEPVSAYKIEYVYTQA